MRIIGCDLHSRQQTLAVLDVDTGEVEERVLAHEGEQVREFYAGLPGPVRVGIEATGSMHWFLELMNELGVECQVGHPAKIRACEPRKQKHDRRDAMLSEAKARADKELSHLTAKRLPGHHAAKRWEPAPLMRDMANVIEVFIATASAQKLDPDFVVLVKERITDFRRQP